MPLMSQGFVMTFLTILKDTEVLCSFRLVIEGKTEKQILKSSRLELMKLEMHNTSRSLNRGGIAGFPLLRTL